MPSGLLVFFALVALYGALSVRLDRVSITMPIVFVIVGALAGPRQLVTAQGGELLSEMTLALLLFADASTLAFRNVRDDAGLSARLLLIAMPLAIVLGAVVGYALFPREPIGAALLLAAILAPTDPALGLPLLNNRQVPARIRRALTVESGLNDGIIAPLFALFTAMPLQAESHFTGVAWLLSALSEIGIGVVVGIAAGLLGGRLFAAAVNRGWTAVTGEQIGSLALAMCAFWMAKTVGGNAFVAAFVGGLVFGHTTRERLHVAVEFTETVGTLLSLFVWAAFGANLVRPLLQAFDPLSLLYGLLSLTVVRMLPVAVSMVGAGLRPDTTLIMGWFGPRGLPSVVFVLIAAVTFHGAGQEADLLVRTATWTILLSVVLHGISAVPLSNWYAHRLQAAHVAAPDLAPVREVGVRRVDPLGWLKSRGQEELETR